MAKITYTDKVKIKDIPVAEINKFTDANANEIKAVVNAHADSIDANTSAIENIAPVEYTEITQVYNVVTQEITEVYNVNYINNINRIIRGQVVWTGVGYTFKSVNLFYEINGTVYYSNGEEVTNSAPDATNPRLDVIYVSSAGLAIKEGVPDVSPVEPSLDSPESQVKTNLILVNNGTTTPIGIAKDAIYKENDQEAGGEWDTETSNPTAIDLANTLNPITGINSIKTIAPVSKNSTITFSNSTAINLVDFNNFTLDIRQLDANWWTDYIEIRLYDFGLYVGNSRIDKNYIDMRNTTTAQEVVLTKEDFNIIIDSIPDEGSDKFDTIELRFTSVLSTTRIQVQIDNFYVQYGDTSITPPQDIIINASDVKVDTKNFDKNLSAADDTVQKALDTLDDLEVNNPTSDTYYLGYYATELALTTAHPTAIEGNYAVVGFTDTVWLWSTLTTSWVDSDKPPTTTAYNSVGLQHLTYELKARVNQWEQPDEDVIDWTLGTTFMRGTITSAITLSDANLPKGRETKQISFFVTGDYGITVPAYWNKVGGTYDGTKRCEYRIRCVNGNNTFQDVSYSIYVDGVVGGTASMDTMANMTNAKTTPIDADNLTLWDSVASSFKKVTWLNIKATLKTYFDTVYLTIVNFANLGDSLKARVDMGTGTVINWSLGISYKHTTLTGAITFTDSNLPTGTDTKCITLDIDGDFAITFPAYYVSKGGTYDGTVMNRIVIDCINGTASSEEVYYTIIPNA